MNRLKTAVAGTIALAISACPVWAAEAVEKSRGQKILEGVLPLLIALGLIYFLFRRVNRRNKPYMDRALVHMDRLEKQNDEIIGLLKEMAGKKQAPEQNPPPLPRDSQSGKNSD